MSLPEPKIEVVAHGPYEVTGGPTLRPRRVVRSERGEALTWKVGDGLPCEGTYYLCRCGQSQDTPLCDGSARRHRVLWEEEPLLASDTFQSQIEPSADADVYLGIFWSRIGSRLPATISRPDGSRYESGTVFELEQALARHRAEGRPDLLVYRRLGAPTMSLASRGEVLERLEQMQRLEEYLDRCFVDSDGSFKGAFHTFHGPDDLEEELASHLRKLVASRLESAGG